LVAKFSEAGFATIIPIRDMSRAIKFYTKALGGKLTYRGEGGMKDAWASVKLGKEEFWLVTPQTREKRTLAYSTFLVKDVKSVVKELREKGVRFQRAEKMSKESRLEGPIAYDSFGASAFFKDSEGNLLMIWQNIPPM
jgi:predicted enzyme related to lactoylglutathione lyase